MAEGAGALVAPLITVEVSGVRKLRPVRRAEARSWIVAFAILFAVIAGALHLLRVGRSSVVPAAVPASTRIGD